MGTNYYIKLPATDKCDKCGRESPAEKIQIGKSSFGWKFCFNTYYGKFKSFVQWKPFIGKYAEFLCDEYGRHLTPEEFYKTVESKQGGLDLAEYWRRNPGFRDGNAANHEYYDSDGYLISKFEEFC